MPDLDDAYGKKASTAIVQIGNSDDKLKQYEWNQFYYETEIMIKSLSEEIHFSGLSPGNAPWQNACFVLVIEKEKIKGLMLKLNKVRSNWRQDSIAVTIGSTYFVKDDLFADWIDSDVT